MSIFILKGEREGERWREGERLSLCEHLYPERSEVMHHITSHAAV